MEGLGHGIAEPSAILDMAYAMRGSRYLEDVLSSKQDEHQYEE